MINYNLDYLPNEIHYMILNQVANEDLPSCACTCRTWYGLIDSSGSLLSQQMDEVLEVIKCLKKGKHQSSVLPEEVDSLYEELRELRDSESFDFPKRERAREILDELKSFLRDRDTILFRTQCAHLDEPVQILDDFRFDPQTTIADYRGACQKTDDLVIKTLSKDDGPDTVRCTNSLTNFPGDFKLFGRLKKLDLSGNGVGKIPRSLFEICAALTQLNLSNNNIRHVPKCLGPTLEVLDLSDNQITKITALNAGALRELNLSDNQITGLFDLNCPLLEGINLRKNRITDIVANIPDITSLKNLRVFILMDNTELSEIPSALYECKRLERLSISGTAIKEIPPELFEMPGLNIYADRGELCKHVPAEANEKKSKSCTIS